MKLLPNEQRLISSNENKVILTDHRIEMTDSVWGQSFTISMFLENISSIEVKYKHKLLVLILACLFVVSGLYLAQFRSQGPMAGAFFLGALCFVWWWFTRRHVISISPDGGSSLNFEVQGMSSASIDEFICSVATAKQNRIAQLYKLSTI
jgi:hypothetical protein